MRHNPRRSRDNLKGAARFISEKVTDRSREGRNAARLALAAVVGGGVLALAADARADPCTATLPKRGAVFSGAVVYVGDGDSLCVGKSADPHTWIEIRLADFYAPELHEPGGRRAKETLSRLAMGSEVTCTADHRSYDRIVAVCTLSGESLGDLMRRDGVSEGGAGSNQPPRPPKKAENQNPNR